jgi:hypothetical protein
VKLWDRWKGKNILNLDFISSSPLSVSLTQKTFSRGSGCSRHFTGFSSRDVQKFDLLALKVSKASTRRLSAREKKNEL